MFLTYIKKEKNGYTLDSGEEEKLHSKKLKGIT